MNMNQIMSRMRRVKFIQHVKNIRKIMTQAYNAKWYEIQCLSCGVKDQGTPDFIKAMWGFTGCSTCHSPLGYTVLDMSNYQRQRVYYRDPITNELTLAPRHDMAYKITRSQREKKQNYSFKADLKNDGLLRRPSSNRTNKILGKVPKYNIEIPDLSNIKKLKDELRDRRCGFRV